MRKWRLRKDWHSQSHPALKRSRAGIQTMAFWFSGFLLSFWPGPYTLEWALRLCDLAPAWLSILTTCQFSYLDQIMLPSTLRPSLFTLTRSFFSTFLSLVNLMIILQISALLEKILWPHGTGQSPIPYTTKGAVARHTIWRMTSKPMFLTILPYYKCSGMCHLKEIHLFFLNTWKNCVYGNYW